MNIVNQMDIKSLLNSGVVSSKFGIGQRQNEGCQGRETGVEPLHSPPRYVERGSASPMNGNASQSESLTFRGLNTRVIASISHFYPSCSNLSESAVQDTHFALKSPHNLIWRIPSYTQSFPAHLSNHESRFPSKPLHPPRELLPSIAPEVRFEKMSIQSRTPGGSLTFLEKHHGHDLDQDDDRYSPSSTSSSSHESEEVLDFGSDHKMNTRSLSTNLAEDVQIDRKCYHADKCILKSEDRKVVSQFFGRNKACTRAIPDHLYGNYCRKHYQRTKYRAKHFGVIQMDLVRKALDKMQAWGGITEFEFALRLRARKLIENQDNYYRACEQARAARRPLPPPHPDMDLESKERFLVPYLGKHKSFDDMFDIIDMIEEHIEEHKCDAPEIEILPSFRSGFEKPKKLTQRAAMKPTGVQKTKVKASESPRSRFANTPSSSKKILRRQSGPGHSTLDIPSSAGHRKGRSI